MIGKDAYRVASNPHVFEPSTSTHLRNGRLRALIGSIRERLISTESQDATRPAGKHPRQYRPKSIMHSQVYGDRLEISPDDVP